jgi:hypothetical protein
MYIYIPTYIHIHTYIHIYVYRTVLLYTYHKVGKLFGGQAAEVHGLGVAF